MRRTTRKTLSATTVAGRYRLQREMARGGMGTVWLARDDKLGREVAVKVMSRDFAEMPEATSRFEREAKAAAGLRSSHVVEVYDYGIQEGLPFIVMEMLEGENLGQRLKRLGRLSLGDVAALLQQICLGLKSAHGAGLVHRDLKPSNIFLAQRDGAEVVKLLDFGVVKATDIDGMTAEEATMSGMLLGTPQYMSPEQARATRELDQRSDLWSVGVIIFRLLTGHNPFKGESVGDVVLKICSDALPKITDINPALPQALNPFFERAFARQPEGRFQTAEELSAAFVAIAGAVVSQPPVGAPVPFGKSTLQMSSSGTNQSRPSFPGAAAHVPGTSGVITPVSGMTAPRASMGSIPGTGEATPISTTVGGTQLASLWPKPTRPLSGQPVALVVAGAATLITFALVAAIWLGSSPAAETAPTASPAARADIDLISNDDDGDDTSAAKTDDSTDDSTSEDAADDTASADDEGAGGSEADGAGGAAGETVDLDEPDPKTGKAMPTPRPATTPAQPRPKSGTDRPDWGLSGK